MAKKDPVMAIKGLILFRGKYLLLLRNKKEEICPLEWDIPGGGIEPEETVEETLIREIKEETGIDISSSKIFPIKKWKMDKGGIKIGGIDFLCVLDNYQKISLSAEHIRAQWFSREEIMNSKEIPGWLKESVGLASARLNKK